MSGPVPLIPQDPAPGTIVGRIRFTLRYPGRFDMETDIQDRALLSSMLRQTADALDRSRCVEPSSGKIAIIGKEAIPAEVLA